jgi:hypothetical protein
MELDIKVLEAKRDEYQKAIVSHRDAVEQHTADMHANVGALQAIEELLAVAKAPPKQAEKH